MYDNYDYNRDIIKYYTPNRDAGACTGGHLATLSVRSIPHLHQLDQTVSLRVKRGNRIGTNTSQVARLFDDPACKTSN